MSSTLNSRTEIRSPRPNSCCASERRAKAQTGVVVEESGVEDSYHAETAVFRHHSEGSQLALGTGDQHDGAYGCAQVVGHVFAEDDGGHGGDALVDGFEGVGRFS